MPAAEHAAPEVLQFGCVDAVLMPHYVATVGPRVFVTLHNKTEHFAINLTPDDARKLANFLKIAACEAESRSRCGERRVEHGRA